MKRTLVAVSVAVLAFVPAQVTAQGFAVAGRGGTLGFGAEGALAFGPNVAIRGGMGLWPIEFDATEWWDAGPLVEATLKLPKTWYNIGADLYLGGSFRVGGGLLFKSEDPSLTASLPSGASIEIGGITYSAAEVGEVVGRVDSKSKAPYAIIGFGKHTQSGIGLFLDLGVAFLGDSPVVLEGTQGSIINSPVFQTALRVEEAQLEEDLPTWARKYWPILNLGIKIGVGS